MPAFLTLAIELLQNLILAFAVAMVYGLLVRRSLGTQRLDDLATGSILGVATVTAMLLLPIVLGPGVIWDARALTVAAAGVFGGPLGAAVAGAIGAICRLVIGGAGAPAGVIGIVLAALGGGYLGWRWRRRGVPPTWRGFGTLGLYLVAGGLASASTIPGIGLELVGRIWAPLLAVTPAGMVFLGLLLMAQWDHGKLLSDLRASERRFRAIFNSQFQSTGLLEPDGTVVAVNRSSLAFGNIKESDVIGRPFWEARWWTINPETQERLRQAIASAAAGEFVRYEVEVAGGGFTTTLIDFSLKPVRDERGRVVLLLPEGRDISALRRAEAQAREAMRMQAVGKLTGGVAHEFNNLLQVIIGCSDLQRAILPPGSEGARHAERILAAADRGAMLTQQLLAFSGQQPLSPERVDLSRSMDRLRTLANSILPPGVTVTCDCATPSPHARVDVSQLEHGLLNLLLNARDALPSKGGRIEFSANEADVLTHEADRLGLQPGRYACLEVTDSGHGMTTEVKERAFDPFFTTKDVGEGVGLGLSMVQGFARQSGGAVELWSAPGRGTCVRLLLPLAGLAKATDSVEADPHDEPQRQFA